MQPRAVVLLSPDSSMRCERNILIITQIIGKNWGRGGKQDDLFFFSCLRPLWLRVRLHDPGSGTRPQTSASHTAVSSLR